MLLITAATTAGSFTIGQLAGGLPLPAAAAGHVCGDLQLPVGGMFVVLTALADS